MNTLNDWLSLKILCDPVKGKSVEVFFGNEIQNDIQEQIPEINLSLGTVATVLIVPRKHFNFL